MIRFDEFGHPIRFSLLTMYVLEHYWFIKTLIVAMRYLYQNASTCIVFSEAITIESC
jgi:hypothetical protein